MVTERGRRSACAVTALVWMGAAASCRKDAQTRTVDVTGDDAALAPGLRATGTDAASVGTAPGSGTTDGATGTAIWEGHYRSQAGTLFIPADWKGVKWNPPDTNAGLGEGLIRLAVDGAGGPSGGRVQGHIEGPLGPALVDGMVADGKLTATVTRADPSDHGFYGTMVGTLAQSRIDGTLSLAPAEVNAVRQAPFSLSPTRAGTADE